MRPLREWYESVGNARRRRFMSAREFYKREHWTPAKLVEKGGNLAIRMLAVDAVLREQGQRLFPDELRTDLLHVVGTTVPMKMRIKKGRSRHATTQDRGGDEAEHHGEGVRDDGREPATASMDVP